MNTVLQIENLSKTYRTGEFGGLIKREIEKVNALQNVSFQVEKGEVLGIIGKNGAGKSTLLKLLSQITSPSAGVIRARGRISSLLEVGTGMHPELTGRENVFLNGAILGMNKAEITSKFDEIVDFSGCAAFIDTPIKRYSSGMKVRLGFSVAAFLDSEIIIIDEVLAVGDADFQTKAIQKIIEITADGRKTILFVSHNMASVKSLCSRCILLDKGELIFDGGIDSAISKYLGYDTQLSERERAWTVESAPGNEQYKLLGARIVAEGKAMDEQLDTADAIIIELDLDISSLSERLDITLQLHSQDGDFLAAASTIQLPETAFKNVKGQGVIQFSCKLQPHIFNQMVYRVHVLLIKNRKSVVHRFDDLFKLAFNVSQRHPDTWMGQAKSYFLPKLEWEIKPKKLD